MVAIKGTFFPYLVDNVLKIFHWLLLGAFPEAGQW